MAIKLGGGGGSASFPTIFLHKSQTWVPPQDGNIMIHVIGAGGSGSGSTTTSQLQSGGAGGYCRKDSLAVTTSSSFTVVIGAGGAVNARGVLGNGVDGGTTTVSGTGLSATLTATGGARGILNTAAFSNGGVGSNGDFNTTGGRGGYHKGGGAVGLLGTGRDGTNPSDYYTSTGGDCDIVGDFYSSSLGQISGSLGPATVVAHTSFKNGAGDANAGPLAGAGSTFMYGAPAAGTCNATIGGGGGFSFSNTLAYALAGKGGEGCVVIQYIP